VTGDDLKRALAALDANRTCYEYTTTAVRLRQLEATSETQEERAHWQSEAGRFEDLARIAETNPADARRRYRPMESYLPPVAEYVEPETAYGHTVRLSHPIRVF
jgi:hypothetical protein